MDQKDHAWDEYLNYDACASPLSAGAEAVGEAAL